MKCSILTFLLFFQISVSEGVYKEYDQLKLQYDMELGAMQKAMEKAHQVRMQFLLDVEVCLKCLSINVNNQSTGRGAFINYETHAFFRHFLPPS